MREVPMTNLDPKDDSGKCDAIIIAWTIVRRLRMEPHSKTYDNKDGKGQRPISGGDRIVESWSEHDLQDRDVDTEQGTDNHIGETMHAAV